MTPNYVICAAFDKVVMPFVFMLRFFLLMLFLLFSLILLTVFPRWCVSLFEMEYWLVVSNIFSFPFHIWDVILPIDSNIFQDG